MNLYYGCSQWGYENWKGKLYPQKATTGDFLRYYAKMFNAVELNPTFHNGAEPASLVRWKNKVDERFRFCPKIPKRISHEKRLSDFENDLNKFLTCINLLGVNLGVIFLQLSNFFGESDLESLDSFLGKIPDNFRISIEPRIPIMQNAELMDRTLSVIRKNKAGIVITDSIESREYVNCLRLTNHSAFIRFISYGHNTDFQRIDEWINQLIKWQEKGLPEAYFFLHFPVDSNEAGIVEYFLNKIDNFKLNQIECIKSTGS